MNDRITVSSELLKEQYTEIKHKSGLSVYVFPKNLTTSYAIIATKFGSVDNCFRVSGEKEFTRVPDGVAHFLEHKMFENEDGEDTFVKYSRTGASGNAFTSFGTTAYLFSCTDNFYESLDILLKTVYSPYFTPENVSKEQGIIAQEIRMCEDDPSNALLYGMLGCLYKESSIKLSIAGTVESISEITPEILYKCHSAFYNPENMVLCVCGDVDCDKVMEVINKTVGKIEPQSVESYIAPEEPTVSCPSFTCKMQVAKPLFCIGVKDTALPVSARAKMERYAAMQVIASLYFGKSSSLYSQLLQKGLISPSFTAWSLSLRDFSLFSINGDSQDPIAVYESFKEYVKTAFDSAPAREDFEAARRAIYSSFIKEFDSTQDIATNLAVDFAIEGGSIFEYAEILRDIKEEDVLSVARELFKPSAFAISTVYPI